MSQAGHGIAGDITADFFRAEYKMNHAIATFPKPQVALWDGIVMVPSIMISKMCKHETSLAWLALSFRAGASA